MAFYVERSSGVVRIFYCGDTKPYIPTIDVVWFLARGYELAVVRQQFENIPVTKGDSCAWAGELAKFVFDNLQCPWPPLPKGVF